MDKIYIIEDDENIRNLLKIALEGFGYEAESGGCPRVGRLPFSSPGVWGRMASSSFAETSSSLAGEGKLLLPS